MAFKNISTSNTSIAAVNADNLTFADKTMFIGQLEADPDRKSSVFLRPRRFGKTLFTDILMNYYDRSLAESFDETFSGMWIHDHRTPLAGSYYCVRFDFSTVSSDPELVKSSFTNVLAFSLKEFSDRYPELGLPYSELKAELYAEPADLMRSFIANFRGRSSGRERLYIIIDEYDHFVNDIFTRDAEAFRKITSTSKDHTGFIKQFYACLKESYGGIRSRPISRFFITGVSSVSLDSLTSGFNICRNISNDPWCNTMAGFTHEELSKIIDESVDFSQLNGLTKEQILPVMEKYYDGYTFSFRAGQRIFNSTMCLSFLKELTVAGAMPIKLVPDNAGADLGKLEGMLAVVAPEAKGHIVERIFMRDEIYAAPPAALNLNQSNLFDYNQAVSMLMYLGYLTIAPAEETGSGKLMYRCPNEIYYRIFLSYTENRCGLNDSRCIDLSDLVEKADISPLISQVETIIAELPDSGFSGFNERTLQMCFDFVLRQEQSGKLSTFLEYETGNHGKADIYIDNARPDGHRLLIELKYLSKSKASEKAVSEKLAEAVQQLRRYSEGPRLQGTKPMDCWAVVFEGGKAVSVQQVVPAAVN